MRHLKSLCAVSLALMMTTSFAVAQLNMPDAASDMEQQTQSPEMPQDDALIDGSDLDILQQALNKHATVNLTEDGIGDPLFQGRMNGEKFEMYLFGCDDNHANCDEVMFKAAWATIGMFPLEALDTWNRQGRYGKAYRDSEGDPVLEMNVNLENGVSLSNFDDTIMLWKDTLARFKSQVVNPSASAQ